MADAPTDAVVAVVVEEEASNNEEAQEEPATNGVAAQDREPVAADMGDTTGRQGGRSRVSRDTTTVQKFQRKKVVIDNTVGRICYYVLTAFVPIPS